MWGSISGILGPSKTACSKYEARLADAANVAAERGGAPVLTAELSAHVSNCERCRAALDAIAPSRALLRSGVQRVAAPGPFFAARVMAAIRAEEERLATQRNVFWRPLEHLAARLAIVSAMVVMALSFYIYAYVKPVPRQQDDAAQIQSAELVPHQQIDPQPQTKDDVLMLITEDGNAR
jgi:predicted anti-sigma-YlaC factor YlaD